MRDVGIAVADTNAFEITMIEIMMSEIIKMGNNIILEDSPFRH